MVGSFDESFGDSFDVATLDPEPPEPSPPTDEQSACWLTQAQLDKLAELHPELTADQIGGLCLEATWVLDELTNNYYHGDECWFDVYEMRGCDLVLSHGPVSEIQSVNQMHNCDTSATEITGFCQYSPGRVSICPEKCGGRIQNPINHCGCPKRIKVTYSIDNNLPPGARAAVFLLANEYGNAITGKKCSLPERITSISRQGVSWTILDPQSFIDKGLIGISRLDSWIAIARRSAPQGRAIDPLRFGKWLYASQVSYGACPVPVP